VSSAWVALAGAGGLAAGVAAMTIGDLLSEEVRERADRLPYRLIQRAGRRLSADVRVELTGEWTAELHAILDRHGADRLPLTRFVIGTRYAVGLLRAAGAVDCALRGQGSARLSFRPGIGLAAVRAAAPVVRAGCFGVGFGISVGTGANVGAAAGVALGLGGAVGALLLGILVGARMVAPSALGVGLGAGLSANLGLNATSLSLAVGGVFVVALTGTVVAGPADRGGGEVRPRRGRRGHRPL
jgi:hypothetical protein